MIQSMTGFARAQSQEEWGSIAIEIRSINHRYLEISLNLPEPLHEFEMGMREHIKNRIKRGKVECQVRYQANKRNSGAMIVDTDLVKQLGLAAETIGAILTNSVPVSIADILAWPGVLQLAEANLEQIQESLFAVFDQALDDLVRHREREGVGLSGLFEQRLAAMTQEINKIRAHLPEVMFAQRERLQRRFVDARLELNPERLEQEMVLLAQKTDVLEEIERLEMHISEVARLLREGGVLGRRLDFLMQELNREANTLGSKAINPDTIHAAVELKVLVEQMREQVQNIE